VQTPPISGRFSERFSWLSPFHNSSSILRAVELWPELAVPVCSVKTLDYWTRADVGLRLLAHE